MDNPKEEKPMEEQFYIGEGLINMLRDQRPRTRNLELTLMEEFLTEKKEKDEYLKQMSDMEDNLKPPEKNKYSDPVSQARYEEWWNLVQISIAANERIKPLEAMYVYIFLISFSGEEFLI